MKIFKLIYLLLGIANFPTMLHAQNPSSHFVKYAQDEYSKCAYYKKSRMAIVHKLDSFIAVVVPDRNLYEVFSILPDSIERFHLFFYLDSNNHVIRVGSISYLSKTKKNYTFVSPHDADYCEIIILNFLKDINFYLLLNETNKAALYKMNRYDRSVSTIFYKNDFYTKGRRKKYDCYVFAPYSVFMRGNEIVGLMDYVGKRDTKHSHELQQRARESLLTKEGYSLRNLGNAFAYVREQVSCKRGK